MVLLWVAIELLAVAAWWWATGSPRWWRTAAPARAAAVAAAGGAVAGGADSGSDAGGVAAAQAAATAGIVVHPFFGYVDDARVGSVAGYPISAWGFVDSRPPLRTAAPDRFVVGIVGGSVALQTGHYGGEALATALRRSPLLRDRTIDLVHLALGGYRQPQQLQVVQLLSLLGGHFDAIINLDGFNEVALVEENVPNGVPGWYPRGWSHLAGAVPGGEQLLLLGELAALRQRRASAATLAGRLSFSPLSQFAWWWWDGRRARDAVSLGVAIERAAAKATAPTWPPPASGPGAPGSAASSPAADGPVEAARGEMARLWARASLALHQFCSERGIVYCHLLQPNQYLAGTKPIGPEEAARCLDPGSTWQRGAVSGYPLLRAEVPALLAAGVDFTDLTEVFVDHPEPLYVDTCCHFGAAGADIVAEHLAGRIRRRIEASRAPLVRLEVPARLEIGPLEPVSVPVVGVTADGARTDLTGSGVGTRLRGSDPDQFAISATGTVRARRRGPGKLLVEHGELRAEIAVDAQWPDELVGKDAVAAAGSDPPRLRLVDATGERIEVAFADLPASPWRLLVVGDRPPPSAVAGQEAAGFRLQPVAVPGTAGSLVVPPAAGGHALFLRAYALAADAATVVAITNTLVLTRD